MFPHERPTTYADLADALSLIRKELLEHKDSQSRLDIFGEQMRPLYEGLRKYFEDLDRQQRDDTRQGPTRR